MLLKPFVTPAIALAGITLTSVAQAADDCPSSSAMTLICGPQAVEDMVQVGDTPWIIGSGLAEGDAVGGLHLIDSRDNSWSRVYPAATVPGALDRAAWPQCPGAPSADEFSAHGLAIRDDGDNQHTLLVVNHDGREAIEVFRVLTTGMKPSLLWTGCVPMPDDVYVNSVTFLPDGGIAVTKFYDRAAEGGIGAIFAGEITGGVIEWHRDKGFNRLPGTDLVGANGIVVTADGKTMFVAAWGTAELVRFNLGGGPLNKQVITLDFVPDNIRWAPDGKLLVTGQQRQRDAQGRPLFAGWRSVKVDPKSLAVTLVAEGDAQSPMQGVSVGIEVGHRLWIGPYRGDRIASLPLH